MGELIRVLNQYGLKPIVLRTLSSAYHRKAAFFVKTYSGMYVLKPFQRSQERLTQIHLTLTALSSAGFTLMPKWILTQDGEPWVKIDDQFFYVTEWIQGEPLTPNSQACYELGKSLGKLHSLDTGLLLQQMVDQQKRKEIFRTQLQCQRFLSDWQKSCDGQVGHWLRLHGEECETLLRQTVSLLERYVSSCIYPTTFDPSVIHGDVTTLNALHTADGVFLIDWECIGVGDSLYELAKSMANTCDFETPAISSILKGYQEANLLTLDDKLLLAAYFSFPREAIDAFQSQTTQGKIPQSFSSLCSTWERRKNAVSWVLDWAERDA